MMFGLNEILSKTGNVGRFTGRYVWCLTSGKQGSKICLSLFSSNQDWYLHFSVFEKSSPSWVGRIVLKSLIQRRHIFYLFSRNSRWKWFFRKFFENGLGRCRDARIHLLRMELVKHPDCGATPYLIAGFGIHKIYH